MDSHNYADKYHKYDFLAAAGAINVFSPEQPLLDKLDQFYSENNDWIFGHLGYDLKNEIENLNSNHTNKVGFNDIFLFIPDVVVSVERLQLTIYSVNKNPEAIFNEIFSQEHKQHNKSSSSKANIQSALTKQEYVDAVKKIQQHILRGDCYELNFCQEFFAENISIDPLATYTKLVEISPTPFSCFYKLESKYLLCASPERFLSKSGDTIFSQPIKGTAPRNANIDLDNREKENLSVNKKEQSENVMIVDLVRNDLSKICKEGSVNTEELFAIYSFPQVHQMISTVKGELNTEVSFAEIIRATFPMGSMTGAPKRSAMQLIEQCEKTKRQLFSGSIGYITPNKNFDFNVVIRSIFYNAEISFLNYLVGSAITFYADAEKEYEECLLKSEAIIKTLQ